MYCIVIWRKIVWKVYFCSFN